MMEADDKAFLGAGWAFPPRLNDAGEIATTAHEEDIREAIRIILETIPGERVMRPDFGSGLRALAFEPINVTTRTLAALRAREALIAWEPRIDNIDVEVTADTPRGVLLLDIRYRVRTTNTFYNLVYPFYLLENRPT